MIVSDSGGSFEQLEPGMYDAVCVMLANVGTQQTPFKNEDGTDKVQKKVVIQWETEKGNIAKEYTMSLNEKANLRKDLVSWRGKQFTEEELEGFEISKLLGAPCTLQIVENDKKRSVIQNVLPKGKTVYKATKPTVEYDIDNNDDMAFDKLPAWIQKKVMASYEYKELPPSETRPVVDEPSEDISDEPIDLSQIPF